MIEQLKQMFPKLMAVLDGSKVKADLKAAEAYMAMPNPCRSVHEAKATGKFKSGVLTTHLCAALVGDPHSRHEISDIEADLARIATCVKPPDAIRTLKQAYRDKLLNDDQFDDVKYEIASAVICCDVFDKQGVSLEECLPDSAKNPDITGALDGQRSRVEVTVVHDNWPPAHSDKAQQIAESATVGGRGYSAHLNIALAREADGELVKRLIECLYAKRSADSGKSVVNGFTYYKATGNEFRCDDVQAPLSYLEFTDPPFTYRQVHGACFVRNTITTDETAVFDELFPKPEGVFTTTDVPHNRQTYRAESVGLKIYEMLNGKRAQCEVDSINIIILGQPMPMNDTEVMNAVRGSEAVLIPLSDADAAVGAIVWARTGMGPFTPRHAVERAELSQKVKDYINHEIEKFRIMAAVLVLRLEPDAAEQLILNPNADKPLPPKCAERLRSAAAARTRRKPKR